jgi:hypothetical protein
LLPWHSWQEEKPSTDFADAPCTAGFSQPVICRPVSGLNVGDPFLCGSLHPDKNAMRPSNPIINTTWNLFLVIGIDTLLK